MHTLFSWVFDTAASAPPWWVAVTSVISAASAIAAATPTPKDDKIVSRLYRMVEVLALNIGHAKDTASKAESVPKTSA